MTPPTREGLRLIPWASLLLIISGEKFLSANNIAENTICSATPEILGYFSMMTQHFFWHVNLFSVLNYTYSEFLMKPKESAGCHQTFSSPVGSGDETKAEHAHTDMYASNDISCHLLGTPGRSIHCESDQYDTKLLYIHRKHR